MGVVPVKTQLERLTEAEIRAYGTRVKVFKLKDGAAYKARSKRTGERYTLTRTEAGWTCTCPGFTYTGMCLHIGAVSRRSHREHWSMGAVAVPEPIITEETH